MIFPPHNIIVSLVVSLNSRLFSLSSSSLYLLASLAHIVAPITALILKKHSVKCFLLLATLLTHSCTGQLWQEPWQIEVRATDHLGNNIADVEIQLSGVMLGKTDSQGLFQHSLRISGGKSLRLYAHRTSEEYYYSPYIKTFELPEAERFFLFPNTKTSNSKIGRKLTFTAVLHSILKQNYQTTSNQVTQKLSATPQPPSQPTRPPQSQPSEETIPPSPQTPTKTQTQAPTQTENKTPKPTLSATQKTDSKAQNPLPTHEPKNKPESMAKDAPITASTHENTEQDESPKATDSTTNIATDIKAAAPPAPETPPQKFSQEISPEATKTTPPKVAKLKQKSPKKNQQKSKHKPKPSQKPGLLPGLLINVLHHKSGAPIPLANIYLGYQHTIEKLCITSRVGQCYIRKLKQNYGSVITLISKKPGYLTTTHKVQVAASTQTDIRMPIGKSFDLIALLPQLNSIQGLPQAELWLGQTMLGKTNSFGFFSYSKKAATEKTLSIVVKSPHTIPSEKPITLDSQMNIVALAPLTPASHKVVVLPAKILGNPSQMPTSLSSLREASIHHLFRHKGFTRIGYKFASQTFPTTSLHHLTERGFANTELEQWVSLLLATYVYPPEKEKPPLMEMSLYNKNGYIVSSATATLDNTSEASMLAHVPTLISKLTAQLTIEASILKTEDHSAWLNMNSLTQPPPSSNQSTMLAGMLAGILAEIKVWRWKSDPTKPRLGEMVHIGLLNMDTTSPQNTSKILSSKVPLQPGDLVEWIPASSRHYSHSHASTADDQAHIRLLEKNRPLKGVMVYLQGEEWIGTTNYKGAFKASEDILTRKGPLNLEFRKPGYSRLRRTLSLSPTQETMVYLERTSAYVTIHSKPSGKDVLLGTTFLGKTPISTTLPISAWREKPPVFSIIGGEGYKNLTLKLPTHSVFIDFAGPRTISLQKDYLAQYYRLKASQNSQNTPTKTLAILNSIPANHWDFSKAIHLKALHHYENHNDTQALETWKKLFSQKRIARNVPLNTSYLYAALTSFRIAEAQDRKKNFSQSLKLYKASVRYLRESVKIAPLPFKLDLKLAYHWALSEHRMALIKKDRKLLQSASNRWSIYLSMAKRYRNHSSPLELQVEFQEKLNKAEFYAENADKALHSGKF